MPLARYHMAVETLSILQLVISNNLINCLKIDVPLEIFMITGLLEILVCFEDVRS